MATDHEMELAVVSISTAAVDRVRPQRVVDRVVAIFLRAGAALPRLRPLLDHPDLGYLRKVALAGGFKSYEQKCVKRFKRMLAPKFAQLPEDVIPNIVLFAFHPGMYEINWSMPPSVLARIRDALLSWRDQINSTDCSQLEERFTPVVLARLHASLDLPADASTTEFLGAVYDAAVEAGVNPMPRMTLGEYMSWTPPRE